MCNLHSLTLCDSTHIHTFGIFIFPLINGHYLCLCLLIAFISTASSCHSLRMGKLHVLLSENVSQVVVHDPLRLSIVLKSFRFNHLTTAHIFLKAFAKASNIACFRCIGFLHRDFQV